MRTLTELADRLENLANVDMDEFAPLNIGNWSEEILNIAAELRQHAEASRPVEAAGPTDTQRSNWDILGDFLSPDMEAKTDVLFSAGALHTMRRVYREIDSAIFKAVPAPPADTPTCEEMERLAREVATRWSELVTERGVSLSRFSIDLNFPGLLKGLDALAAYFEPKGGKKT